MLYEQQINQLLCDYEYLIKIIVSKYNIPSKDYDDVLQEGRLGLLKAIKAFQNNKGANFNTFASLCIDRQILSYLRNQGRKKNKVLTYSYSFDQFNELDIIHRRYNKGEFEDYVILKLHFERTCSKTMMKISSLEQDVFQQYMTGYSIQELSEEYDIPKKKVYVIIAKVKKRLEEKLNQE